MSPAPVVAAPAEAPAAKPWKVPESVLVVIYTAMDEVLVLRRHQPANFWQSVTGTLDWRESPRECAERELREETGLEFRGRLVDFRHTEHFPIIQPWRVRYAPGVHYNREHWFGLWLPARRSVHLNPEEHSEMRWLPFFQAALLASSWTNRNAILQIVGGYAPAESISQLRGQSLYH